MKKFNITILAIFVGVVLVLGQPHAMVTSSSSSSGISVNEYSTGDVSVDITAVASDATKATLPRSADGTYHLISDTTTNLVKVYVNVAGFTYYDDIFVGNSTAYNETTGDQIGEGFNTTLNNVAYAGELYLVVNGQTTVATAAAISSPTGIDVTLSADFNVISFVYAARNQDTSKVWASDTVIVRVAQDASELEQYNDFSVALNTTEVDDLAYLNNETTGLDNKTLVDPTPVNTTGLMSYNYFTAVSRNTLFRPTHDLTISYTDASGAETSISTDGGVLDIQANQQEPGAFKVTGTIDSSGFDSATAGGDFLAYWGGFNFTSIQYEGPASAERTAGLTFVQDASGVRLMEDASDVTILTSSSNQKVLSTFSIFTLADYGTWNYDMDIYGSIGIDHNGQFSAGTLPAGDQGTGYTANASIIDAYGWAGGFHGSNDFVAEGFSVNLATNANDQEQTVTSTVEDSPGFGALVAILALGTIAYALPRFRKD